MGRGTSAESGVGRGTSAGLMAVIWGGEDDPGNGVTSAYCSVWCVHAEW